MKVRARASQRTTKIEKIHGTDGIFRCLNRVILDETIASEKFVLFLRFDQLINGTYLCLPVAVSFASEQVLILPESEECSDADSEHTMTYRKLRIRSECQLRIDPDGWKKRRCDCSSSPLPSVDR